MVLPGYKGSAPIIENPRQETITIESHHLTLSGTSDPTRGSIIARIDPSNNLPTTLAYRYNDAVETAQGLNAVVTTVSQSNFNLSEPQKELLRWHFRLGHVLMRTIQFLMRSGVLAQSEAQRRLHLASCKLRVQDYPKCAAYQ